MVRRNWNAFSLIDFYMEMIDNLHVMADSYEELHVVGSLTAGELMVRSANESCNIRNHETHERSIDVQAKL